MIFLLISYIDLNVFDFLFAGCFFLYIIMLLSIVVVEKFKVLRSDTIYVVVIIIINILQWKLLWGFFQI